MGHFRGTVQGYRGEASRLGSEESGLTVTCNGWNGGVTVEAFYDKEKDEDVFVVTQTGGSGYNGIQSKQIARFSDSSLREPKPAAQSGT